MPLIPCAVRIYHRIVHFCDIARVKGANLARDADVVKNLDQISALFGIDIGSSTRLSSKQRQALKTCLRPAHFRDSQGKAGDDGWG